MLSLKTILSSFYKAGCNTVEHDGVEQAGNLAFLGLLALFPFLVFIVSLAGFLAEGQAGKQFIQLFVAQLPPEVASALAPRLIEIMSGPPHALLTVSILGAIWTSSSAVHGYRYVLNRAYRVGTPHPYVWGRLLSVAQTLLLSFIVVIAMTVLVVLPLAWEKIEPAFGKLGYGIRHEHIVGLSFLAILSGVSSAYYFLPNLKQSIRSAAPGAMLVTFLLIASAQGLSLYLARSRQTSLIYGSLGGFIATLLFFYVSNIIFIYGAELNYLLKIARGDKIEQRQPVEEAAEG